MVMWFDRKSGDLFILLVKYAVRFAFLPLIQSFIILTYNIPSYRSSPYFQKIINSLNMSRSTIAESHFGVYARL